MPKRSSHESVLQKVVYGKPPYRKQPGRLDGSGGSASPGDCSVASADRIRIIYRVAGSKGAIDLATEAIPGGAVRVRAVDRPITQGRRIVIGLGERAAEGVATVSVEARKD